jgi:hypothetical protein
MFVEKSTFILHFSGVGVGGTGVGSKGVRGEGGIGMEGPVDRSWRPQKASSSARLPTRFSCSAKELPRARSKNSTDRTAFLKTIMFRLILNKIFVCCKQFVCPFVFLCSAKSRFVYHLVFFDFNHIFFIKKFLDYKKILFFIVASSY